MSCCCAGLPVAPAAKDWIRVVVDEGTEPLPCRKGPLDLRHGDDVVVETADGRFVGRATLLASPVLKEPRSRAGRVVRRATEEDLRARDAALYDEATIGRQMREHAAELHLEINIQKVRVPISGRKAIVYFTSEQRVDFRRLVRQIARQSGRRIEMRPLGVRDGAKIIGALGPCGRCLCCVSFMNRFHSVTVRMAKRQSLSLNPTKISGMCGRLMCCLSHEVENYPTAPNRRRK
ncbi:MAG: hypothetical protein GXP48_09775 [Acidobacteria bacterium]|nr:hypothetical protein [Acidobacteriota bacterium]